jgi:hypothetical protein
MVTGLTLKVRAQAGHQRMTSRQFPCRQVFDLKLIFDPLLKKCLGARSATAYPPACLEAGKMYKVVLQFRRHDPQIDSPTAAILVDSVSVQ